jgi:hypothetical protein
MKSLWSRCTTIAIIYGEKHWLFRFLDRGEGFPLNIIHCIKCILSQGGEEKNDFEVKQNLDPLLTGSGN